MNYEQRLKVYHEKMARITVEYGSYWNEMMEKIMYSQSVGFGKPSIVDKISNKYILSRKDLQLVFGWEEESYRPLPERKGFIGTPSYKLIKNHNHFIIKDVEVEEWLSKISEDHAALRVIRERRQIK